MTTDTSPDHDHHDTPGCGCQARAHDPPDQAVGSDPERKRRILNRLKRIEGQARGLQKMVQQDRYCADVLAQISSVQEALRATSKELLRNHLEFCATEAIREGPDEAEEMYDELTELMHKHLR